MIATGSIQSDIALAFRHDTRRDRTILHRRQAGGLCHVGKPYWDHGVLGLQLVNPTAGIFSGDALHLSVEVGAGARVALGSPSATRFHTMAGCGAKIVQEFDVGAGGWLDYRPEWTIPQRDSEVDQVTRIRLDTSSRLVFLDLIAPGRVAHGECYAYRRYTTEFELRIEDNLVARERMELVPEDGGWPLAVPGWKSSFYAALWLVGTQIDGSTIADLERKIPGEGLQCGASQLDETVWVIRLLSEKSVLLRNALREIRTGLAGSLPLLAHDFRRL